MLIYRPAIIWALEFEDGKAAAMADDELQCAPGARDFRWLHVDLADQRSLSWIAAAESLPQPWKGDVDRTNRPVATASQIERPDTRPMEAPSRGSQKITLQYWGNHTRPCTIRCTDLEAPLRKIDRQDVCICHLPLLRAPDRRSRHHTIPGEGGIHRISSMRNQRVGSRRSAHHPRHARADKLKSPRACKKSDQAITLTVLPEGEL
jgi:hypothetical protein